MFLPFIDRNPSSNEIEILKLCMSLFTDGSGQEKDKSGASRPGWRDYERIIGEFMGGRNPENKCVFDVTVKSKTQENAYLGISVKSKKTPSSAKFRQLDSNGRVYMEIANSPAKFWEALNAKGLNENSFRNQESPDIFGITIIDTVESWHYQYASIFGRENPGVIFDLDKSIYLSISYFLPKENTLPIYQLHSFVLKYPSSIQWKYRGEKCISGYDPDFPNEVLLDWYPFSGGQLKYYPSVTNATFQSPKFQLVNSRQRSIFEKASMYWPKEWAEAEGSKMLSVESYTD